MNNATKHRGRPETIKTPLQSTTKSGKTIFAYLRRSTKKEEQKDSKEKQNDCIDIMAHDIGIDIDEILIFEDDFTGYKVDTRNGTPITKRPGYKSLMEEIDKCKTPCILLVYDVSRLARNIPDGTIICEKLGLLGNMKKKKIEYIRFYDGTTWDSKTQEKDIYSAFLEANSYSSALAKKKQDSNIASLIRGIMPKTIKAPPGLKNTTRGMEETESMTHVRRAFEMKAEGKLEKEISKYLALYGINIRVGNLMTILWAKTQYIGEYTHPKTGEVFENLKFTSGKTAISRDLWDRVHRRIGKKAGGYRDKQQGDIIRGLLKWEHDRDKAFSVEIKKGKHKSYKSNAYGGFNKSEKKIMEIFCLYISKVWENIAKAYIHGSEFLTEREEIAISFGEEILKESDETIKDIVSTLDQRNTELYKNGDITDKDILYNLGVSFMEENNIEIQDGSKDRDFKRVKGAVDTIMVKLVDKKRLNSKIEEKQDHKKSIEIQIEKESQAIKTKHANLIDLFASGDITKEEFDISKERMGNERRKIESLQKELERISESSDIEEFFDRLPDILGKTFELSSKVLSNADIEGMKEDILKLMEICTFELEINTKKELKVKLLEPLEEVLNLNGGQYRIRTYDPLRVKQVL